MNEYICREAILDDLEKEIEAGNVALDEDVWVNKGLRIAIRDIKDIKSADVQLVVHCKDCKHRKELHYEESGEKPYVKYECKFTKYSMSDDGFCSFGVRMDGDTNE